MSKGTVALALPLPQPHVAGVNNNAHTHTASPSLPLAAGTAPAGQAPTAPVQQRCLFTLPARQAGSAGPVGTAAHKPGPARAEPSRERLSLTHGQGPGLRELHRHNAGTVPSPGLSPRQRRGCCGGSDLTGQGCGHRARTAPAAPTNKRLLHGTQQECCLLLQQEGPAAPLQPARLRSGICSRKGQGRANSPGQEHHQQQQLLLRAASSPALVRGTGRWPAAQLLSPCPCRCQRGHRARDTAVAPGSGPGTTQASP